MPRKESYWKDPEKHRAATNAYRLDHPDWHRRTNREWANKKRATPEGRTAARKANNEYRERNKEARQAATTKWAREKKRGYWLLKNAQYRAKKLGLPFDLKWADIVIPEVCPVLGITLVMQEGRRGFSNNSPSIDRLNPSLGYTKANIRVISQRANTLKRDATPDELRAIIAYMEREGWSEKYQVPTVVKAMPPSSQLSLF